MNSDEAKTLALILENNALEVDLHGIFPEEAIGRLDRFIYDTFQTHERVIKVIYGIGSGTLKKSVLSYVGDHPLIEEWIDQGGYCVASLHRHI
jgi:DNA-nicking Smr family endonuclease